MPTKEYKVERVEPKNDGLSRPVGLWTSNAYFWVPELDYASPRLRFDQAHFCSMIGIGGISEDVEISYPGVHKAILLAMIKDYYKGAAWTPNSSAKFYPQNFFLTIHAGPNSKLLKPDLEELGFKLLKTLHSSHGRSATLVELWILEICPVGSIKQ